MERQRGTVKWFSREKGWGFIRLESGEDIFVHHSDIEGEGFVTLEDDQPVEFSVEEMEKGPRARNVREVGSTGGQAPPRGDAASEAPREATRPDAGGREDRDDSHARDRGRRGRAESEGPERSGGRRPLAEQLRERLARHFPGIGG